MKKLVLINGVPASGKSTVARAFAHETGWPLLTLDTVKEAFFAHLGTGDRDYNRLLGKASYQAMFALLGDWPDDSAVIMDAWFGFQPLDVLQEHLARAGACSVGEVWCHAPPEVIGDRYRARLGDRHGGHLGLEYVPELIALAQKATPLGKFPLLRVDTTQEFDTEALHAWLAHFYTRKQ
jgi:predicted kinase